MLVITTEALAEADRLKLQCTLIEPVPLTPLITRLVTSIDGAVLLDPEGYCYSIGVILDGRASGRGDSTRGARYNSGPALRGKLRAYPCIAIVVSEDGHGGRNYVGEGVGPFNQGAVCFLHHSVQLPGFYLLNSDNAIKLLSPPYDCR